MRHYEIEHVTQCVAVLVDRDIGPFFLTDRNGDPIIRAKPVRQLCLQVRQRALLERVNLHLEGAVRAE